MLLNPAFYELNYSKINAYINCPLSYKYQHILKRRAPLNAPSSLGITIHRAMEAFYRQPGDFNYLLDCYNLNWNHAGFENAQEQMEYHNKGIDILKTYWPMEEERKTKVEALETDFQFIYKKWCIRGTIDRIDRHPEGFYEVIDYKTGAEMQTEEDIKTSLQLGVYGIGAREGLGIIPSKISIIYMAHAKKITVDFTPELEELVINKFEEIGEQILTENFEPNHAHCPNCLFNKSCSRASPEFL